MDPFESLERDYYDQEEYNSDENRDTDSSDDDVQKVMASIAGIQRPIKEHSAKGLKMKQDAKEFESDMEDELTNAFNMHRNGLFPSSSDIFGKTSMTQSKKNLGTKSSGEKPSTSSNSRQQDSESDSDDDILEKEGRKLDGAKKMTEKEREDADALFYDPDSDLKDAAWVKDRRTENSKTENGPQPLPNSDAVLNCPACMSLLTLDCQRHEIYKTQYRAMFVENVSVDEGESVYIPSGPIRKAKKRPRKPRASMEIDDDKEEGLKANERVPADSIPESANLDDYFHPVTCKVCHTEVGVCDSDELYHFFNVLSSYT